MAIAPIKNGENVIKYGFPIGHATADAVPGTWMHTHNIHTNLSGEDTREGLAAIVSVKLEDPQFESQTKSKLGNSEVRTIVNSLVGKQLADYLEENPQVAKLILDRGRFRRRQRQDGA